MSYDWPDPKRVCAPADNKDFLEYYKFEKTFASEYSNRIVEITKYNYIAFGAIFLLANSSYFANRVDPRAVLVAASAAVVAISVSSSLMVIYYYRYLEALTTKFKLIEKALWRQRPWIYIQDKYMSENLPDLFQRAAYVSFPDFWLDNYVLKWVNLIPAALSIGITLLVLSGNVPLIKPDGEAANRTMTRTPSP